MKLKETLLATGILVSGMTGFADERTGREFSELVREMNNELATAKVQVKKLEEAHRNRYPTKPKDVLPERKTALESLQKLSAELKEAETPETRKAVEAKVQDQVIKVAELSADYLEYNKDELLNQDKQLEVMEKALANVILNLDKMRALTSRKNDKTREAFAKEKLAARRELQSMAKIVEMFATKAPKSNHWQGVRQTILLQDAVLKKSMAGNSKLYDMLAAQKQVYEQTHAQIVLARQGIGEERGLLSQIALGEVARSMLRKAAGLLLGDFRVENVGMAALSMSENRQKSLLQFITQDQDTDISIGSDDSAVNNGMPNGYEDFLNKEIN